MLLESKNPPGAGGSSSLEVGRQVIDDDDSSTRSVGQSVSRSHMAKRITTSQWRHV